MFPKDIARVKAEGNDIIPMYIKPTPRYIELAKTVLDIYRMNVACTYGDLHDALDALIGTHQQHRLLKGYCHILENRLAFRELPEGINPQELRKKLFAESARLTTTDFVTHTPWKQNILRKVADETGITPEDIDNLMYCDLKEQRIIEDFEDLQEEKLIGLYNLSLAQTVLLKAHFLKFEITFKGRHATQELRKLMGSIKFFGLLFDVKELGSGKFLFYLDGPNAVLSQPQKYGFQLACFLITLYKYAEWEAEAEIGWNSENEHLQFHIRPDDFIVEMPPQPYREPEEVLQLVSRMAEIAPEWKSTGTPPLLRLDGQNIWIPDVELREQNTGKKAFIEIIGPWRSGYLARRLETLKKAGVENLILIVSEKLKEYFNEENQTVATVLFYKMTPRPKQVMEAVRRVAK